jgi:hypothetical protein
MTLPSNAKPTSDAAAGIGYWIRFLDGRWLIYGRGRVIADLPGDNAAAALAFLRQKQEEQSGSRV